MTGRTEIDERFAAGTLDADVWVPAYLPAWSSRAEAAATWRVDEDGLTLSIPPEQGLWCADRHDPPLRVSAVQSANWSGPVGSTRAQQPFRDGLTVREEQPPLWGFTPHHGRIEVECRATLTPAAMFSAWMVGLEDEPDRCGEICIVEVFGDALEHGPDGPTAALGAGIHAFRDPRLREEFAAPRTAIDVTQDHVYAVDWRPGAVDVLVDGTVVRTLRQAPAYPLMLILGVFDFPAHPRAGEAGGAVPELTVRRVTGWTATDA
ncbi:glycoside hydrolase family 16 protein [Patulibacter americanus]|uniref:glycoside hydrolase family 16 protein n=1 Tax=Patulibacter americanus TaxID=588672 RepID=UPI0003B6E070|nr:glycoside hydrolase family 16 protein [Patulibacter americanus]